MVSPGKYTATPRPGGTVPKGSGMYMNSYEPQGQLISEKKLKSPEEVLIISPNFVQTQLSGNSKGISFSSIYCFWELYETERFISRYDKPLSVIFNYFPVMGD